MGPLGRRKQRRIENNKSRRHKSDGVLVPRKFKPRDNEDYVVVMTPFPRLVKKGDPDG